MKGNMPPSGGGVGERRSASGASLPDKLLNNSDSFSSQSSRETKAASHVLQTVWSYKELRNALTKDGWNKSHFQVGRSEALRYMGGGWGWWGALGRH